MSGIFKTSARMGADFEDGFSPVFAASAAYARGRPMQRGLRIAVM